MWVITSDDQNDDGQNKHESATMRKKGKQTYKQTNIQTNKQTREREKEKQGKISRIHLISCSRLF